MPAQGARSCAPCTESAHQANQPSGHHLGTTGAAAPARMRRSLLRFPCGPYCGLSRTLRSRPAAQPHMFSVQRAGSTAYYQSRARGGDLRADWMREGVRAASIGDRTRHGNASVKPAPTRALTAAAAPAEADERRSSVRACRACGAKAPEATPWCSSSAGIARAGARLCAL